MSYVIFVQTTEILVKEELKKTTEKEIWHFSFYHEPCQNSAVEVILEPIQNSVKSSLVLKKLVL